MSEKKQTEIEEMAKAVCHLDRTCDECMTRFECKAMIYAKRFYDTGYRKASDVAAEIFEQIDDFMIDSAILKMPAKSILSSKFAELKKKYTEGEG